VQALNEALLVKAGAAKLVKTDKVRADTTVVEANVTYPTDSALLVRAITRIVALVALIHSVGAASRTTVRDRRRAAGRRARSISAHLKLRNDDAKASVVRINAELTDLAEATAAEAGRVLANGQGAIPAPRRGRLNHVRLRSCPSVRPRVPTARRSRSGTRG
jgi:IS5 family transposase